MCASFGFGALAARVLVAAHLAHRDQRRTGWAADFLDHEVRPVAAVAERHPGSGRAQRPLHDRGAAVRAAQHLAATAATQRARSARFELDAFPDAPWLATRMLRVLATILTDPWRGRPLSARAADLFP